MQSPSDDEAVVPQLSWVQRNLDYAQPGGHVRFALILLAVTLVLQRAAGPDYATISLVAAMGVLLGHLRDLRGDR